MLYEIVPPLLFFASLGGIILIASRVVVRIRQQELSHAIQTEGALTTPDAGKLFHPKDKGISLFTNRVAVALRAARQSATAVAEAPTRLREARQARRQAEASRVAAPAPTPIPQTASSVIQPQTGGITAPRRNWRERLASTTSQSAGGLARWKERVAQRRRERAIQKQAEAQTTAAAVSDQLSPSSPSRPRLRLRHVEQPLVAKGTAPKTGTETAIEKKPTNRKPHLVASGNVLAKMLQAKPKPAPLLEARAALEASNYQRAEELLVAFIVKHPKDDKAYLMFGEVAASQERWDDAYQAFRQAVRLTKTESSEAYAGLGQACMKLGHVTRALEALQKAHSADPKNSGVLKNLLLIAQRSDNKVLQRSVLEELHVLEPGDSTHQAALQTLQEKQTAPTG